MNSSVHLSFFVLSNCSDMEIESARLDFVTSKATFNMLLLVQGWDLHIYLSFKFSRHNCIFDKYIRVNTKVNFLQKFPFCKHTILQEIVNISETSLKAILRKCFWLSRRLLNNVGRVTKLSSLQCWFQWTEQVKISCSQVRSMEDVPVMSHCSLLRNHWPKPTGVLDHYRARETNCWFSISGRFFLTEYLRRRRTSMDISFFTATISANCTSEFWALFKATKYKAPVVNTRRWLRSSRQWEVLLPYLYSIAAPEDHLAVYLCYVATNGIMTENEELWEILKKLARTYFKIQS